MWTDGLTEFTYVPSLLAKKKEEEEEEEKKRKKKKKEVQKNYVSLHSLRHIYLCKGLAENRNIYFMRKCINRPDLCNILPFMKEN
jgi:hypothetical protein